MNDRHLDRFLDILQIVATNFARFVTIQYKRFEFEKENMSPQIVQAMIDLINSLVVVINTDTSNTAAAQKAASDAQAALAALQQTDAALQDPALLAAANAAIQAGQSAVPGSASAAPTPAPVAPSTPAPVGAP